ncbi:histidine acid phosphatase [Legionella oakridgensis ATCC 33761 = DSM 21215]|uniref:Histidine acid phosphatase n=3 Tax=Legionella oakridgensis TaxID=29423 RepID=W0BHQ6_9GAMM|nr:histidine acid phosphatase [Legionella oakridgensis ATCC 33761 = DSM 21215]ETO92372.1 histidine phosphatase superfamily [Legionella oakridgensis RV-2-2007]KTD37287.1 major acid phosphatase Map (histidine-acid phosphatase) [Legionella oakridgensis]STY21127.1 major acid phosphatase Map (histidine-acid phosphatase) [Legionella longbeachae]
MLKSLFSIVLGFFVYTGTFAQGKLIFAIDVVRHGDRTPITPSPGMAKIWPQGIGQLTPEGMRQEYNLGKTLRQQYVNEDHLLPKHYDINTMNVRSSGIARTLMSAQSILFGLYPLGTGPFLNDSTWALPEGLQPIPIDTVPLEQDSLLVPDHDKELSKRLLETYIFNSQDWIQKDQALKSHYSAWSKIVSFQINNLIDLIYVSDRLFIERLYNIPLPNGLSEKDAEMITEAGKWAWLSIYNHPTLALIAGNELAQTIKREINFATSRRNSLKYLLFVAHDSTLAAQLKLLGQTIDDIPPYASRLNYALFDMGASNFEVRVTYNQKPLLIKQCGGDSCSLNDFVNLIEQLNNEANTIPKSKNGADV